MIYGNYKSFDEFGFFLKVSILSKACFSLSKTLAGVLEAGQKYGVWRLSVISSCDSCQINMFFGEV